MQNLLDEMEVALTAMGIRVTPIKPLVDFDSLPTLKLPSSFPGAQQGSPQDDSGGEGTGQQGASDGEPLEEDPLEELGDSTLEAQARGVASQAMSSLCMRHLCHATMIWAPTSG